MPHTIASVPIQRFETTQLNLFLPALVHRLGGSWKQAKGTFYIRKRKVKSFQYKRAGIAWWRQAHLSLCNAPSFIEPAINARQGPNEASIAMKHCGNSYSPLSPLYPALFLSFLLFQPFRQLLSLLAHCNKIKGAATA